MTTTVTTKERQKVPPSFQTEWNKHGPTVRALLVVGYLCWVVNCVFWAVVWFLPLFTIPLSIMSLAMIATPFLPTTRKVSVTRVVNNQ